MFSNSQFLRVARYNSTLPTLADGDFSHLQVDNQGRLIVSQDVNVSIDFLGDNGAADSSNILVVGTEDGTSSGTAHAFRLESDGSLIISDGGNSVTVDATDLDIRDLSAAQDNVAISDGTDTLEVNADGSINITDNGGSLTVDATDLDIRDLDHTQDSVQIGDGTDLLDIVDEGDDISSDDNGVIVYGKDESDLAQTLNFQGDNLKVVTGANGTDANAFSDASTDGVVESIDNTFTDLLTDITVAAGETLEIYGAYADADKQAFARIVRKDTGTPDEFYLVGNIFEERAYDRQLPDKTPLRITGGANITVNLQVRKMQGSSADMGASGAIFARLIS